MAGIARFLLLSASLSATVALPLTAQDTTRVDSVRVDSAGARPHPQLKRPVRVCAGGDVTLGTNLDTAWASKAAKSLRADFGLSADPDSLVPPLRAFFVGADLALVNVEGAIGEGPTESKCKKKSVNCYAFRQPANTAGALRTIAESPAVLVGNVANNHAQDAGDFGRDRTVALLREADIFVTGADTLATPVVVASGDTIGVLGFHTDVDSPDARDLSAVRRHVARAVEQFGTVIVTMHLGAEGAAAQRTQNATEIFLETIDRGNPVAFADSALAGGATLIIGHGPHVVRAAQWRGPRLVFYSLGNLLTYGPFNLRDPMNRGVVACATIDSAGFVGGGELRPTMQLSPGVVRADSVRRTLTLVDSLSALDFPQTGVTVDSAGVLGRRSMLAEEPYVAPVEQPKSAKPASKAKATPSRKKAAPATKAAPPKRKPPVSG